MKKGEKYDFSLFVSSIHSSAKKEFAEVRIVSKNGDIIAQNKISLNAKDWKQQTCTLIATADDTDARLEIMPFANRYLCTRHDFSFPTEYIQRA